MSTLDPFRLEVLRHALGAIAEEMSFVVMRSARSPLLREAGDLSSALTDARGALVAQGRDIPVHLGVMSFTVGAFLQRVPAEREGDMLAQVAATGAAETRLLALCAAHGAATVEAAMAALHDRSEAAMRAAIGSLPQGEFLGEDFLDDDGPGGAPAAVRVRITVRPESATFDFSATDDALVGPLNTTPYVTAAAVYYAMKAIAGPEIQPNGGCYRPLEVVVRPGSLLDPPKERPLVGGNHETSQRMVDAIFRAFAAAIPERLSAGGSTTAGLLIFGGAGRDGAWKTLYEPHGGGEGARHDRAGVASTRVHLTNTNNTPAEIIEAEFPIRVERHGLRRGSGGAGVHAGGEGAEREYHVLAPELSLTTMFERRVIPPWGLAGGGAGAPFRCELRRPDGSTEELRGKANLMVRQGDRVVLGTSGGGGYGKPG